MDGGVHDALVTPAATEAAVPVNPSNEYVIVCVKDVEYADIVMVPELSIVKVGTVIVDFLGMVVSVQFVLGHESGPGAGEPAISNDAEHAIVFVPSALCVTVVVPLAIVQYEFFAIEYLSDRFLSWYATLVPLIHTSHPAPYEPKL